MPALSAPPDRPSRGEAQPDGPSSLESFDAPPDVPRAEHLNVLVLSFLSLFVIGFGVWLVSAGSRYRAEYAASLEGWRIGGTRMVELSVIAGDKYNLACASDQTIGGLSCGHRASLQAEVPVSPDNPQMLQPFNTVANELLLAAGLWTSTDLKEPLPQGRFSVVCNYHIKGVLKSALVRFDLAGSFSPVGRTLAVGSLTDCVLPR